MVSVTWLGDEDPAAQRIEQFGHIFVKGIPTDVPDKDPNLRKLKAMTVFAVGKDGDVVESTLPAPVDPDAGTERAALKAELDRLNIAYDGRWSDDKLRAALVPEPEKPAAKEPTVEPAKPAEPVPNETLHLPKEA